MIPLSLITGFLGSGKTTLLRNLAEQYADRKLIYLVNEFSSSDVDGKVLQRDIGDVVALPGGSIFCKCLVTEFIRVLRELPEQFEGIEGVVIEASGIANPKVVSTMLRETKLDELYELRSVVAVVDPGTFPTLKQTLPNIIAQVESSDVVLINKIDLYELSTVEDTIEDVLTIQPMARILHTTFGMVELDLFEECILERSEGGEYAGCVDPNYAKVGVRLKKPVNVEKLVAAIQELGDVLYRAKGFVLGVDGTQFVDITCTTCTVEAMADYEGAHELTLILAGAAKESGEKLAWQMKSGAFNL